MLESGRGGMNGAALPMEAIRYSTLHLFLPPPRPPPGERNSQLEDRRLSSDVTRKQLRN